MVSGGEPRSLSDDVMPCHPVMFREAWVDMLHDVKDEDTRPLGLSTIKSTFSGRHVIFIVLKNSTQVDPHSLGLGSYIRDPGLSEVSCKGNCPRACKGPLYSDCRDSRMSRMGFNTHPVKLLRPVGNGKYLTARLTVSSGWKNRRALISWSYQCACHLMEV